MLFGCSPSAGAGNTLRDLLEGRPVEAVLHAVRAAHAKAVEEAPNGRPREKLPYLRAIAVSAKPADWKHNGDQARGYGPNYKVYSTPEDPELVRAREEYEAEQRAKAEAEAAS
ncbi:MAG: hypothetical protein ABII82_05935 [Verrucomicrobiota bacterium]